MSLIVRLALLFSCAVFPVGASINVVDDMGRTVSLSAPAQRIISLSPHLTELLFAAGAGDRVIAVSAYSDYPRQALTLPKVGGGRGLNIERIVSYRPDLVVAWKSGNPNARVQQLIDLGIPVFYSEPASIDAIATTLERLGRLAASTQVANAASRRFRKQVERLRQRYQQRSALRVFYQIWDQPLMTVNGRHVISEWLEVCGASNIFSELSMLAPAVSLESVVVADPDVIIAGRYTATPDGLHGIWSKWSQMVAVLSGNLLTLDTSVLNRQVPRVIDSVDTLCQRLDEARQALQEH
ncbi:MAG: cobalamin-binding protein [Gammaproteobacteria bacterium]